MSVYHGCAAQYCLSLCSQAKKQNTLEVELPVFSLNLFHFKGSVLQSSINHDCCGCTLCWYHGITFLAPHQALRMEIFTQD